MRKFNNSSSFGNRDSRPPRRSSGGSRFGSSRPEAKFSRPASGRSSTKDSGFELHEVTCDKCGVKCDIPFKPTNNKPVYCRSCFRKNEGSDSRSGPDRFESRNKDRFESKSKFNDKFGDNNDSNSSNASSSNTSNISPADLDKINRKLDKIMKALKIE